MGMGFFCWSDGKILAVVVMMAKPCENTKTHRIVHLKMI